MAIASVRRDGPALAFAGALVREAVPALWADARRLGADAERFDLSAVSSVDSAGLALTLGGGGGLAWSGHGLGNAG